MSKQKGRTVKRIWKVAAIAGSVMAALQSVAFVMFMFEEAVQAGGFAFMPASGVKNWTLVLEVHRSQVALIDKAEQFTDSWGRLAFWTYGAYKEFFQASRRTAESYRMIAEAKLKEQAATANITKATNTTKPKTALYVPRKGDLLIKQWVMDKDLAGLVELAKPELVNLADGKYYLFPSGTWRMLGESKSGKSWQILIRGVEVWLSKSMVVIAT